LLARLDLCSLRPFLVGASRCTMPSRVFRNPTGYRDTFLPERVSDTEPLAGLPLRGISSRFIVLMTVDGDGRHGRSPPVGPD
jgi:hypothetical protein